MWHTGTLRAGACRVFALGIALLVSLPAPAPAASRATKAKQAIQQAYKAADAAASKGDATTAVANYSDSTMQQSAKDGLTKLLSMCITQQFTSKIVSVSVPADNPFTAIVVVKQHFQGLIKQRPSGHIAYATSDATLRQYWVDVANQWSILKVRVLFIKRMINNAPVNSW
ncbi:MAG: hypothetical protein ACLQVD_11680 [Capsulimonadaceae bacterium]